MKKLLLINFFIFLSISASAGSKYEFHRIDDSSGSWLQITIEDIKNSSNADAGYRLWNAIASNDLKKSVDVGNLKIDCLYLGKDDYDMPNGKCELIVNYRLLKDYGRGDLILDWGSGQGKILTDHFSSNYYRDYTSPDYSALFHVNIDKKKENVFMSVSKSWIQ
jgi:hypothetical protein